MKYILGISAISAAALIAIVFHDPDATVRTWAVVGFGFSIIAAMVAVSAIAPQK